MLFLRRTSLLILLLMPLACFFFGSYLVFFSEKLSTILLRMSVVVLIYWRWVLSINSYLQYSMLSTHSDEEEHTRPVAIKFWKKFIFSVILMKFDKDITFNPRKDIRQNSFYLFIYLLNFMHI